MENGNEDILSATTAGLSSWFGTAAVIAIVAIVVCIAALFVYAWYVGRIDEREDRWAAETYGPGTSSHFRTERLAEEGTAKAAQAAAKREQRKAGRAKALRAMVANNQRTDPGS